MPAAFRRLPARAAGVLLAVTLVSSGAAPAARVALGQTHPPPTPVPPNGSPSPYPTALVTPEPSDEPPQIRAQAAALVDLDAGQVLYQHDGSERRPIASLTKLMTAVLVVERAGLREGVLVSPMAAAQPGAELGLNPGETVPAQDLLFALLLQSANDAAVALAEHVSGSVGEFVGEMNRRAEEFGLTDTRFFSPSGLDDRGGSTAVEVARLARAALSRPSIAGVVATKFHEVPARQGDPRRIQNRNALLWLYPGATGVKTGFTTAAGYCLVASAERDGERLLVVILGAPSQAWNDAAALLDHGFEAYERDALVQEGQELDPVEVEGSRIPAVAGRSLFAYVREDGPDVSITLRPRGGLSLPVREGQPLGLAVVRVGTSAVGRVPVVVGDLPDPPGTGSPMWLRVAAVLAAYLGRVILRT